MTIVTWIKTKPAEETGFAVVVPGAFRAEQVTETFKLAAGASIDDMRKLKDYIAKKYGAVEVRTTVDNITGEYVYQVIG